MFELIDTSAHVVNPADHGIGHVLEAALHLLEEALHEDREILMLVLLGATHQEPRPTLTGGRAGSAPGRAAAEQGFD